MSATPRTVRAARTMTRIRQADEAAAQAGEAAAQAVTRRRQFAALNGYRGPLTRDEATVITLAALNTRDHR